MTEHTTTPLAPTAEAINGWLSRQPRRPDGSHHANDETYMVDIRTKAGSWRCIVSQPGGRGYVDGIDDYGWWTIRGEGSSNGSRETWIPARKVVAARGHYLPAWEYAS